MSQQSKIPVNGYSVTLEDVSYKPSSRCVLDKINLRIKSGEFVSIIGRNGAGKSTLLSAIAGEIKNITGKISIDSTIIDMPVNRKIDGVGIIHQQDKIDLIGHLSIAQNIYIRELFGGGGTGLFGVTEKWKRRVRREFAQQVPDFGHGIDVLVQNLSGGERQKLSTAIAIHFEHKDNPCCLLLLDEHTAHLDPIAASDVMSYTINKIQELSCTTIMVTHKFNEALLKSDRIVILAKGKVAKIVENVRQLSAAEIEKMIAEAEEADC